MSKYIILIYSKDKKLLSNFLSFIESNFKSFIKLHKGKKVKEKVSVLKSPHVNKTAQELFRYTYFYTILKLDAFETKKNLFILKKIKNKLFPGLKIIIKGKFKTSFSRHLKNESFYNQSFLVLGQKNKSFFDSNFLFKKTIYHLKILDYNGRCK